MYSGPNIERDGLVFGYDTGENPSSNFDATSSPRRFFKGRPTTNLTTNTPSQTGWAGTYTLLDSDTKTFTIETKQTNAATTSAWRTFYWNVSSYIGSYVTISGDVEFVSEVDATFLDITIGQGNTGSFPLHIKGSDAADKVTVTTKPLSKISMTWSGIINTTGIVGFTQWINNVTANNGNSVLRISNVQIEATSTRTPYTPGTRSSTASLLDLTGTVNIDVSNVSFDTDGLPIFDGTDDYITITNPGVTNTQGFTIELVTNPDSYSASPMVITPQSAGIDHFIRFPSTGKPYMRVVIAADSTVQDFAVTSTLPTGNYTHLVFTYNSTSGGKAYFNGNLEGSGSPNFTAQEWSSSWYIGQRGNSTFYYDGVLPVVKVYNRALSTQEIQQNFKAYKNRFNIS